MKKGSLFLFIFTILAVVLSFISVSAQDVDVDNMDNEQLTTLLLQILGKLQQEGYPEAEMQVTPAAAEMPAPDTDPETIEEIIKITIYENKKLMVEALPGYMFIQPTKESKPSSDGSSSEMTLEDCSQNCKSECAGRELCYWNCYNTQCIGDGDPNWREGSG